MAGQPSRQQDSPRNSQLNAQSGPETLHTYLDLEWHSGIVPDLTY